MTDNSHWLLDSLNDTQYAKQFFDTAYSDLLQTRFLPAFVKSTDLIIEAQRDLDIDLVREVYATRGLVYLYLKQFDNAKQDFDCATQYQPDQEVKAFQNLIEAYQELPEGADTLLIRNIGLSSIAAGIMQQPLAELHV